MGSHIFVSKFDSSVILQTGQTYSTDAENILYHLLKLHQTQTPIHSHTSRFKRPEESFQYFEIDGMKMKNRLQLHTASSLTPYLDCPLYHFQVHQSNLLSLIISMSMYSYRDQSKHMAPPVTTCLPSC